MREGGREAGREGGRTERDEGGREKGEMNENEGETNHFLSLQVVA